MISQSRHGRRVYLQAIFTCSLRIASAAAGIEEHRLLWGNCTRLCDYFVRHGFAMAMGPPNRALANLIRDVVTVAADNLMSLGEAAIVQRRFLENFMQSLLFLDPSVLVRMRTELPTLAKFLDQLAQVPTSLAATSGFDRLTHCVSYVVAKLTHLSILGTKPLAHEVALRSWLPLFAGRTTNPPFDGASSPDLRSLLVPEDVDALLKPASNFVRAVMFWAEVQVKSTDTGISFDNVKNIFEGRNLKSLQEGNPDLPQLCAVAGLVIACIVKQRGLMRIARKLNACMTWSRMPKALAFVLRDAYVALRAFAAKEPADNLAAATENSIILCKLFLLAHERRDDADYPHADGLRRSRKAPESGGMPLDAERQQKFGLADTDLVAMPKRTPSASSHSSSDTSVERKTPRWQLLSNFSLALGTLQSSELNPSILSVQNSSAFAPCIAAVERFVFSGSGAQDVLLALADQDDRCFYRAEGFRVLRNIVTTVNSSPLVLPIALGFFDACEQEPSRSLLRQFCCGEGPTLAYSKGCEGASMQRMSGMVESFCTLKSTLTAMLLETTGLDLGVGLLCFDPVVYSAPLTGLLRELQSGCVPEDRLMMVSARLNSILEQLYMCCLQQRSVPDTAQMELLYRLLTCLLTRFTSCLSLALRTLMSFLLLISTDLGFHFPEATWLPVLKQILRLKMEDTVVRRVPTFVVAFHLQYRRRNACAGESSDFAMCWDARIAHDRQGSVQRDAFRLT